MVRGEVVGYACYLPEARTFASIQPSSEIMALYILKKFSNAWHWLRIAGTMP